MQSADVVIAGGGIIGAAVAYYASRKGLRVTLIDKPKSGRATSASAGGLWPVGESVGLGCGVIFHRSLAKKMPTAGGMHGPSSLPSCFFDFALRSNAMFPTLVEELRESADVDVEWEQGSLLYVLLDEADLRFARAVREYGPASDRTQWLTPEELSRDEPAVTRDVLGALVFLGDDQINPYKLADAFIEAAKSHGATVISHTEVTGVRIESRRVVKVEVSGDSIACGTFVNAAGAWAAQVGRMAGIELPIQPVRGQILGTETLPRMLSASLSTSDCYLLQKGHGEVIVGSTTEEVGFDAGVTPAAMKTLAAGAVRAVPSLAKAQVKRAWSGLRPATPDQLPILGPVQGVEGYLNACGHFRTGILNAPLTGQILAEMAAGESPSVTIEPFLLSRFS